MMAGSTRTSAQEIVSARVNSLLERRAFLNLLQMTNAVTTPKEIAWQLTILAQQMSGCEAVAVRLKDGPDFPYAASLGFPERFLAQENSLCAMDEDGHLVRGENRKPILACVCGRVLTGQVDVSLPCYTPCGSFVTPSTSNLMTSQPELEHLGHLRGRCHTAGYETVALFPIRRDGVTYGLIHCNDSRAGHLDEETTELMESLATTAAHLFQQAMA
jgi:GAF domain-containing protein